MIGAVVGLVLLAVAVPVVVLLLWSRSERGHRDEVAELAGRNGWWLGQGPALAGRLFPPAAAPSLMEPVACQQVVSDPQGGFCAEWWSMRRRGTSGPLAGAPQPLQVVRVPTGAPGWLQISGPRAIGSNHWIQPLPFARQYLFRDRLWVAGDPATWERIAPALTPWLPWLDRYVGWLVFAEGELVATRQGFLDAAELLQELDALRRLATLLPR